MKKLFSALICINLIGINSLVAFADIDLCLKDEFASSSLNKNLKIEQNEYIPIEDAFAKNSLNSNLKIRKQEITPIEDIFAKKSLNPNLKVEKIVQKPIGQDFGSTGNKVKISPARHYSTADNLYEGGYIDFVLVQDVKINNKIYKKGSPVKARIENISQNGAYGVPADLVIDNFVLANNIKLEGTITQKGADRAIWVYPTSIALSPFFGIGLLILAVRGGHAKLSPSKIYEIEGL